MDSSPKRRFYNSEYEEVLGVHLWFVSYPLFTTLILLAQWSLFLFGIFYMIGLDNTVISSYSPISPPIQELQFKIINSWPSCADIRIQFWRLLSVQFVHAGFMHIASNSGMLLFYGAMLECQQGFWKVCLIFHTGLVIGSLAHGCILPFRGLIGSSHGAYALCGGCIALLLQNYDNKVFVIWMALACGIIVHMSMDIISYYLWYDSDIGYEAHFFGFFGGFLMGLIIITSNWKRGLKLCAKFCATVLLISLILYFAVHYATSWPPQSINNSDAESCCSDFFSLDIDDAYFYISNNVYCSGTDLIVD
jgi:membrane associated rhomboid family serine protease